MSQVEQQTSQDPPRIPDVSLVPTPQTCYGTLEHSGMTTGPVIPITDVPPDFSWMTQINVFVGKFEVKQGDAVGVEKLNMDVLQFPDENARYIHELPPHWHTLPFCGSRWWNGMVTYKFLAIKPPRVTGKMILRYSFISGEYNFNNDTKMRMVAREWDLGQSNTFEFDVSAMNPVQLRPTWLPWSDSTYAYQYTDAGNRKNSNAVIFTCLQRPHPSQYRMGHISMSVAQRLQPGSLFPSSIRILVFRYFKNSNFYSASDLRGSQPHCFLSEPNPMGVMPPIVNPYK